MTFRRGVTVNDTGSIAAISRNILLVVRIMMRQENFVFLISKGIVAPFPFAVPHTENARPAQKSFLNVVVVLFPILEVLQDRVAAGGRIDQVDQLLYCG